jgi:predicted DCC family thiol-disulfide oxidoreductase YuxK
MLVRILSQSTRLRANNLLLLSNTQSPSRLSSSSIIDKGPTNSENPADPLVTVWWDSSCPLCLREMSLMKKWAPPKTIAFVDIASSSSDLSCPIDRRMMLARFHAQERDGPIVDGVPAFALLWKHIPRMQRLGMYLSRSPKVLNICESLYTNVFLPYLRPTLQKSLKVFGLEGRKYI